MYAIKLKNVSKTYNLFKRNGQAVKTLIFGFKHNLKREALRDVSFTIERGENVAVLGRVNSGRSTLLRLIAKKRFPTEGTIKTRGAINVIFTLLAGFDVFMPARDNIRRKGSMLGWTKAEIKSREKEILEFAEIEDANGLPLRRFQPGTIGRMGFIMHMMTDSDIFLMDESFGVGGKEHRLKSIAMLEEYVTKPERTFVMVTRNIGLARRLCTRGMVLDEGELVFDGNVSDAIDVYRQILKKANQVGDEKDNDIAYDIADDESGFDDGEDDFM